MATLTLYHDTRTIGKDGRSPVKILVTQKRKSLFVSLKVKLTKDEWEQGSSEECSFIKEQKLRADAFLLNLRRTTDVEDMELSELRDRIAAELAGTEYGKKTGKVTFVKQYERFVEHRNAKGTKELYNQTLVKIRQFEPDIDRFRFEDITKAWLSDFDLFLKQTNSPNIRNRHLRNIRAVFNNAIDEEVTTSYPFKGFQMPKLQQTRKRALTPEQIKTLKDYPCMDWQKEYLDMFMLSFYLIGINMVDLLTAKKEDIRDGRLEYRRDKTGHLYSIKIEPEAQEIIKRYPGKDWLLSPMDRYKDHKNYILRMNRALKKIGLHYETSSRKLGKPIFPDISTYWARHSWASIAASIDIPIEIIARSMGHSWIDKTVTSVYIDFDTKKIDSANRKVLDYIK